jgi:lysophospholipase L1-like esterase
MREQATAKEEAGPYRMTSKRTGKGESNAVARMVVAWIALMAWTGVFATPSAMAQEPLGFLHARDVVVFQGDSITDGGRQRTGSDYNHIMGQDYAYIVAAEIGAESPERELVFVNRGISGNRVPDLEARWDADTIALKPQLLSILIGVNDLLAVGEKALTAEEFEAGYDRLLAETVAALPGTKIVLGEPFLMPVGKQKAGYDAEMVEMKKRQAAVERLGAKYHLPVVHYQRAFDAALAKAPAEHWSWDGVHPTYAGHGLMAQEWLKAVDGFWGK